MISVASLGGPPGGHYFDMTTFYDTNRTKKKTTISLISFEIFNTPKWTKNDLKHALKHLFEGER